MMDSLEIKKTFKNQVIFSYNQLKKILMKTLNKTCKYNNKIL